MRSFSVIATIACAALSYAAPLINVDADVNAKPIAKVDASVNVRHDKGVPDVIQAVTVQITTVVAPLTFITSQNATVEAITPVLNEVKTILGGAITEVTAITGPVTGVAGGLVGGLLNTVLSLAGKVLSIADVAGLLATLLKVVFVALGAVLKVVAAADKAAIQPLLAEVVKLVVDLLKLVLPVVGGLLGALLPLVGDVLKIADALGVTDILASVGLKL
ncbi:hypothetical protein V5O48_000771 [Marasmius crinis-equi]|uniref:Uncharacterized protein n=1 Tax=Marasmius crinis-equi TaxID=585013 RepID=A0ABR3G0T0_9AGAR